HLSLGELRIAANPGRGKLAPVFGKSFALPQTRVAAILLLSLGELRIAANPGRGNLAPVLGRIRIAANPGRGNLLPFLAV
ncbi:MAG: hypothetical protein IJJ26_13240, partial [Victivallales bacterium]|nr:hypothetical protein [Victivallales bacterium]